MEQRPPCGKCGGWHREPDPDVDYPTSCVFAFKDWRGPKPFVCPTREYGVRIPHEEYIRLRMIGATCPRLETQAGESLYCGWCSYEARGLSPSAPAREPVAAREQSRPSITPRNDLGL